MITAVQIKHRKSIQIFRVSSHNRQLLWVTEEGWYWKQLSLWAAEGPLCLGLEMAVAGYGQILIKSGRLLPETSSYVPPAFCMLALENNWHPLLQLPPLCPLSDIAFLPFSPLISLHFLRDHVSTSYQNPSTLAHFAWGEEKAACELPALHGEQAQFL